MAKVDLRALKARLDLKTVLETRGLKFKRQGSSFVARCPLHADRTPSFSVKAGSQRWKCFGCGATGDVFGFVQKQEGVTLMEAVRRLFPQEIASATAPRRPRPSPATAAPVPAPVTPAPAREPETAIPPRTIDRPGQELLDRVVGHWQEMLARTPRAQGYLKGRGLWHPEILRAFRVGYASGQLPQVLPEDGKTRHQLQAIGVLNDRSNEFLYRRVVVPIFDDEGLLVNVYGRAIDTASTVSHLYLPGPRRGVFNRSGVRTATSVLVTESVIDALSLVVLGFANTTASYGADGFTGEHLALFRSFGITRVYCVYDADPAGNTGAEQLALDLAGHRIECLRVTLPDVKDPNDFLRGGATHADVARLLDAARPILQAPVRVPVTAAASGPTPATSEPMSTLPTEETGAPPVAAATAAAADGPAGAQMFQRGERTYEVAAVARADTLSLRVRLCVRHEGKTFLNTLNLYSDVARASAVGRIAALFGGNLRREIVEKDLFSIIEELQQQAIAAGDDDAPAVTMSDADRAAALAFLSSPDLVARIRSDLSTLGVVGEDRSKLLVYLVATSRRLEKPLSVVVVSRSSAGKSFLVTRVMEMVPEEERLAYTRLSAKALFHDEADRLKHKLLVIEEAQGMEEAAYSLRVMQSNQMLKNLSTITDPATGRHKAQENVVYGPVALVVTTTQELDFETVSRAFVISVDESAEQTRAIHQMQRLARTRAGLALRIERGALVTLHQNAQRLLEPLVVVNEYAPHLTFPSGTLRLRREHEKYLTLIETITYLFQYQRRRGEARWHDKVYRTVETASEDVDLANELVVTSLRQAFEEVSAPTRDLLVAIRRMVEERADGDPLTDIRFTRRELREHTGWSDHPMRFHVEQLEKLEYIQTASGGFGKQYVYTLSANHRLALPPGGDLDCEIRELGLTTGKELLERMRAKKPAS